MTIFFVSVSVIGGEYTGPGNITKFRALDSNNQFVMFGTWDTAKADNCSDPTRWIVGAHASATEEQAKSMYSLVLAAYMSGKTIDLYIDGCNSSGRPIVNSIWLPERY